MAVSLVSNVSLLLGGRHTLELFQADPVFNFSAFEERMGFSLFLKGQA